jgi:transcriptional regulator with XRE-family HTH domain
MADIVLNTEALRALREARGWDQLTLAQRAGVDPSVISRVERGLQDDMRVSVLVALARTFQVSTDFLLVDPVTPLAMSDDLSAAVVTLGQLSVARQRQVAALLRAYLTHLPDSE